MINVPHKDGVISASNKKLIPSKHYGKHSNGSEWIYFESKEEREKFYADNFPKPTSVVGLNPLIEAVKEMTPEQKAELKALLG